MRGFLVGILAALASAGCEGPRAQAMRYTNEVFPPTEHVDILRTAIPEREYVEIAEVSIRINDETRETAVALLREECAKLGADALVLMGERSTGTVAIPVGQMIVAKPKREMYGVAIEYRQ